MRVDVLTIFPRMFDGPLSESLMGRAQKKNIVSINICDIRSFTTDKHNTVDDRPFGGGPGMVFKPEPLYQALHAQGAARRVVTTPWPTVTTPLVVYLSPQGKVFNQQYAQKLARYKHLILLCGHYEGIDERVMRWVHQEVSVGDYVLTGGEIPAMAVIDSVVRLVPGVVKEQKSIEQESFMLDMLDYPHYTRPAVFKGVSVPKVLLSGNHERIEQWRQDQARKQTKIKRPELLKTKTVKRPIL